jgi:cytochrome c oxidase cbb3-type subunit 3
MWKPEVDAHSGVDTTGHEWDGIKELNNPLPRWWLWTFYITIVWSIAYWVLMPSWPGLTGYLKGLRNHSERANVAAALEDLKESRGAAMRRLASIQTVGEVEGDPELLQYTLAAGQSLFGDNCATCHGAGGQGFPGYPNLNDDSWLWGGSFSEITQTIRYGVRSGHEKARMSIMQAYGRDGVFTSDQISDLTDYVLSLSGGSAADDEDAVRAKATFTQVCAACHGVDAKGSQALGAPDLTDAISLYGGDRQTVRETLMNGRGGVMPAWTERLSDEQINALAVYVHSLGGGEAEKVEAAAE